MVELKKVKLFPIPEIDIDTQAGKEKLQEIKSKGPDWPYFDLEVSDDTVSRGIYSAYNFKIEFTPPPFPESKLQINKFKAVEVTHDMESDTLIVYAFPF